MEKFPENAMQIIRGYLGKYESQLPGQEVDSLASRIMENLLKDLDRLCDYRNFGKTSEAETLHVEELVKIDNLQGDVVHIRERLPRSIARTENKFLKHRLQNLAVKSGPDLELEVSEKEHSKDKEAEDHTERSRNLSEKKRRDQFNALIQELAAMVCTSNRKLDKYGVLKAAISSLREHAEVFSQTENTLEEDSKPACLPSGEFTRLLLESLDTFVIALNAKGNLIYASDSISSCFGLDPGELTGTPFSQFLSTESEAEHFRTEFAAFIRAASVSSGLTDDGERLLKSITVTVKKSQLPCHDQEERLTLETVTLTMFLKDLSMDAELLSPSDHPQGSTTSENRGAITENGTTHRNDGDSTYVVVALGQFKLAQLPREIEWCSESSEAPEFLSRHSMEWKFLYLDQRATEIIGYLPFELLGTSGFDYIHVDDLDRVAKCHKKLMDTGEGVSSCYRFLSKGMEWIWLKTRYYISYHQWTSKPEFVVCSNRMINREDIKRDSNLNDLDHSRSEMTSPGCLSSTTYSCDGSACSTKSGSQWGTSAPDTSGDSALGVKAGGGVYPSPLSPSSVSSRGGASTTRSERSTATGASRRSGQWREGAPKKPRVTIKTEILSPCAGVGSAEPCMSSPSPTSPLNQSAFHSPPPQPQEIGFRPIAVPSQEVNAANVTSPQRVSPISSANLSPFLSVATDSPALTTENTPCPDSARPPFLSQSAPGTMSSFIHHHSQPITSQATSQSPPSSRSFVPTCSSPLLRIPDGAAAPQPPHPPLIHPPALNNHFGATSGPDIMQQQQQPPHFQSMVRKKENEKCQFILC
ncbi:unnamed protein product [Cyprideis torosa]|uniref:Uncharacterized protein n=1 Tax=Cyprideis torosa TaxID=163714 RepID=A0A7R8WGK7_9CRUS|nr:unnamed protein product [Cyprideis torosa]CAG0891870.1 unnamed protein product [Cyprideis torosa]